LESREYFSFVELCLINEIQKNKLRRGARLPPLLMLVLYNGERRWDEPTEIAELIALPPDSSLWHWQPQVRYHLLDMGTFAGEELARSDSLAALLFRLEQRQSREDFCELLNAVEGWFCGHPEFDPLKRLFDELAHRAFANLGLQGPIPRGLVEKMTMLETHGKYWKQQWEAQCEAEKQQRAAQWEAQCEAEKQQREAQWKAQREAEKQQWKAEAAARVRAEALAAGQVKGQADALVGLLVRRFGPLEPDLQARIHAADLATLASWLYRVIDAPDVHSVFETAEPREAHGSRCNGV
jgi:hypothetical protein